MDSERNFLGIMPEEGVEEARFFILPVPLELTTTYIRGSAGGPEALLMASHQVELYDDELKAETFREGILTLEPMEFPGRESPETAVGRIETRISELLESGKSLVTLGGEHTVSVGIVRAYHAAFSNFSVLHLDAHADLRDEYQGSRFNHACVMARIAEIRPFVSVGIRSLCAEEAEKITDTGWTLFDMHRIREDEGWVPASLDALEQQVYITVDLDVFDPAVMPAVGTPEPGGMGWRELTAYLRRVFREKTVIGLDIMELCPIQGFDYGVFTAAKLVYRLLGYWCG